MGQATVDLPDPSEMPAAPMSSADDLLSQMAGDEIDRLLAEAEGEKAPPPSARESAAADDAQTSAQIDALFDDIAKEQQVAPESAQKDAAAIQAAMLGDPTPSAPKTHSTMPGAIIQPEAPEEPEPVAPPVADVKAEARQLDEDLAKESTAALPEVKALEAEASIDEKTALSDAINAIDSAAEASVVIDEQEPIPFYLKPLVWLNLPMELFPPAVRIAIGKVALMTLANSIAILAYVLLFRKHH